jgi:hypothetical protein
MHHDKEIEAAVTMEDARSKMMLNMPTDQDDTDNHLNNGNYSFASKLNVKL